MTTQTIKIKNGAIALPKIILKNWRGADVFIFPSDDTLIVKKIQKSLENNWEKYEEKLTKGWKKISPKIINEAVNWTKKLS